MSAQLPGTASAQLTGPSNGTAAAQHDNRGRIVAGVALIAIGLLALLAQLTNWNILGWMVLPTFRTMTMSRNGSRNARRRCKRRLEGAISTLRFMKLTLMTARLERKR